MPVSLLMVDDQPRITSVYQTLPRNYEEIDQVYLAHDDDEYWEVFERERAHIDVVVMDLMLDTKIPIPLRGETPVLFSGFSLMEQTMKRYPGTRISVLTQYEHETTILSAYRLGARCFLPKHQHDLESFVANMVDVAAGHLVVPDHLSVSVRNRIAAYQHPLLTTLDDEELSMVDMIYNGYDTDEIRDSINSKSTQSTQNKISRILRKLDCSSRRTIKKMALDAGMSRAIE